MPPTGQIAVDFSNLSDAELSQILKDYGVDVGPVNAATRRTYERKLVKLKTGTEPTARYQPVDDDDDDDEDTEVTVTRTSERKTLKAKTDVATSPRYQAGNDSFADREEVQLKRPEFINRPSPILPELPQLQIRRVREAEFTPRIESRPSLPVNKKVPASYDTTVSRSGPTKVSQNKSKGIPLWLKLLGVAVVLILVYLIYANMEPQARSNIPGIQSKIEV